MHASSGGPFGALLMIAPLAAIPVFAIIGIPHFTPVAASPTEEEEFVDLGTAVSRATAWAGSGSSSAASRPSVRRSADDLFAPVEVPAGSERRSLEGGGESGGSHPRLAGGRRRDSSSDFPSGETTERDLDAQPAGRVAPLRDRAAAPVSRPAALSRPDARPARSAHDGDDPWEVVSDLPNRFDDPSGPGAVRGRESERGSPRHPDADDIDSRQLGRLRAELNEEASPSEAARRIERGRRAEPATNEEDRTTARQGFDAGLLDVDSRGKPSEPVERRETSRPTAGPAPRRGTAPTARDLPLEATDALREQGEQAGWQAAARRLRDLGIRRYRLVSQIEEQQFLFRCELPTPTSPHVTELFEAVAETPLEAVRQTLEQIEGWLRPPTSKGFVPLE